VRGIDDDDRLEAASLNESHRADKVDEVPRPMAVRDLVLRVFYEYWKLGLGAQLFQPLLQTLEEFGLPQLGLRGEFLGETVETGLFLQIERQCGPALVEVAGRHNHLLVPIIIPANFL
jgi:hypothetical protein